MGIRPGHIRVTPKDGTPLGFSAERRWSGGTVRLIEHAGGQIWTTIEIADVDDRLTVVGGISADCSVRLGERVPITAAENVLHFYDAAAGRALKEG